MLSTVRASLKTSISKEAFISLHSSIVRPCVFTQFRSLHTTSFLEKEKPRMKHPKPLTLKRIPKYVPKPPPNVSPYLVREDSILKSMVLLDRSQPILLSRIDEIGRSPTEWVDRAVPPPELTFNVARNQKNRFSVRVNRKGPKRYTILGGISGNALDLARILQWRLRGVKMIHDEKTGALVLVGYHVRPVNTLVQALGF